MLNLELKYTFYTKKQIIKLNKKIIVFLGRSNVGKSSLLNSICQFKKLVRVSKTAGKTQSINCYLCDNEFYLVDFPGYGYAKVSKEQKENMRVICERFLSLQKIFRAFLLIDIRIGLTTLDHLTLEYLNELRIPYMLILTKSDKLKSNNKRINMMKKIKESLKEKETKMISHSSLKKIGNLEIIKEILKIKKI